MILLFLLIAALMFGGSYYAYRIAFYSPGKNREKLPTIEGSQYDSYRETIGILFRALADRPCEFVTVKSRDGLLLSGRYYHVKDGAPVDIAFHGYRSACLTDFTGGASLSFEMGHNLLLVDQRAHGKSQGRTIGFGLTERYDVLCWVNYILNRFGSNTKILLYGISMGAATVLMASELELSKNVKGIIADCPYSSAQAIICKVGHTLGFPMVLCWPFIRMGARIYGGFSVTETSAVDAVRNAKAPILLIHGMSDSFVPCDMSRAIHKSNPQAISLHLFPQANHGLSFLEDTPRYKKIVKEFVDSIL